MKLQRLGCRWQNGGELRDAMKSRFYLVSYGKSLKSLRI